MSSDRSKSVPDIDVEIRETCPLTRLAVRAVANRRISRTRPRADPVCTGEAHQGG